MRATATGPERLTILASGLIVVLTVTAIALGTSYALDARLDHQRARASAGALTRGLLNNLLSESVQSGWSVILDAFVPAFSVDVRGVRPTLAAMDARARAFAAHCECEPMTPSGVLLADLHERAWVEAAGPGRVALSAPSRRQLLAFADTAHAEVRRINIVALDEPSGPALAYVRVFEATDGRRFSAAIVIPVSEIGPKVIGPARRRALEAIYGELEGADSVYALEVRFRDSVPVYRSPWQGEGIRATAGFWPEDQPQLTATLTLNPAMHRVTLPTGIPDFPTALVVVAAILLVAAAGASLYALHRARHLIAARTLFLSGVSHELRTPLTQILLYTEVLEDARAEEARRARAVEVIGRETRRLIHMVENVLLFARGSRRDLPLNLRDEAPGPLLRGILGDMGPLLERADVHLDLADTATRQVKVDPAAFRQIVVNLVDNALRYGPRGQRVSVSVEERGEVVEIAVADQGPGIPASLRQQLLASSPRAAPAGSGTGAGLGIALVRTLALAMGATVSIGDAPGGGARVAVAFPAVA